MAVVSCPRNDMCPQLIAMGRFCIKVLGEPNVEHVYKTVTFRVIYVFLDWMLSQKRGADGRAKKGVRKRSTLVTFWCAFRLAFERATKRKIDKFVDRKRISNVCKVCYTSVILRKGSDTWKILS